MEKLNVFDFDNTLYDGDSSIDFYLYSIKKNFLLIRYFPIQIYGMLLYKMRLRTKEYFKERYFSFLNGIEDVDGLVNDFWKINSKKIREIILNKKKNIVIISASPFFLLLPISEKIGAIKLIATDVDKSSGKLLSKNCYGEEKVKRLNAEYNEYIIESFYSDSKSDCFLARISEKSFLVKGKKIINWKE